jgi:enoyl-CoA hydratase/carnithine racemase
MSAPQTVRVEHPEAGVAILRLYRPDQLNALTTVMFAEIAAACEALHADKSVRAVVLTGEGRGFCAGYDLDEAQQLAELSPAEMLERQDLGAAAVLALRAMRQPVIAAVNGPAVGGGLSIALAADIRLAGPAASFSAAFIRLGLSAGDMGCSWYLPRIVGVGHAAEIMFTGKRVDAAEAARIGLVNRVVPGEELLAEATAMARAITDFSPFGTALSKRALYANLDAPSLHAALEVESRGQAFATRDPGFTEALAAVRAQFLRAAPGRLRPRASRRRSPRGPGGKRVNGSAAVVGGPVGLTAPGERVVEHLVLLGHAGVTEVGRAAAVRLPGRLAELVQAVVAAGVHGLRVAAGLAGDHAGGEPAAA